MIFQIHIVFLGRSAKGFRHKISFTERSRIACPQIATLCRTSPAKPHVLKVDSIKGTVVLAVFFWQLDPEKEQPGVDC
jgi:hypothetical protein